MAGRPNKSVLKRFKMTRTGKFLRRPAGLNHFNARALSGVMSAKRHDKQMPSADRRGVNRYLYRA